jgi:predicted DNA-binding mobile mystery protein A
MKDFAYKYLDRKLSKLNAIEKLARPAEGWIRVVRGALGLTTTQLAKRLKMSQPSVIAMEKAEQRGAISMETLERAAEALNCKLVYVLVPNEPLEDMLRSQAGKVASSRLERVSHTMRLEDQAVSPRIMKEKHGQLVEELMQGNLHRLWDEQ